MTVRCLLSAHEAPEMARSCRVSHVLDGCSTPHIKGHQPTPIKTCSKPRDNLPFHPIAHLAIQTSVAEFCNRLL